MLQLGRHCNKQLREDPDLLSIKVPTSVPAVPTRICPVSSGSISWSAPLYVHMTSDSKPNKRCARKHLSPTNTGDASIEPSVVGFSLAWFRLNWSSTGQPGCDPLAFEPVTPTSCTILHLPVALNAALLPESCWLLCDVIGQPTKQAHAAT